MDITYLGHSSFRLKGKSGTVITDPFDSNYVGLKFPPVSADIVTVSHQHKDHNSTDLVKDVKKVFDKVGEYETMGISFIGLKSYHDAEKGEKRGSNIIFIIEIDGLRFCHLGDLGHKLSEKKIEEIGDVDFLFVPVGGVYTLDSKEAAGVVGQIEPSIVVPMHFFKEGLKEEVFGKLSPVDDFLKQMALPVENTSKYSIKKGEISEEQKIIVFENRI